MLSQSLLFYTLVITFPGFLLLPLPIFGRTRISADLGGGTISLVWRTTDSGSVQPSQEDPVRSVPNAGLEMSENPSPMGKFDEIRRRIGLCPFRCRGCFTRFVSPRVEKTALEEAMEQEST